MSTHSREVVGKKTDNHIQQRRRHCASKKNKSNGLIRSVFIVSMIMMVIITVGRLVPVSASVPSEAKAPMYQYYTSIEIKEDDTLWDLAKAYNNGEESDQHYINSIMELNNMNSSTLYSGQYLLIYYFSPEIK